MFKKASLLIDYNINTTQLLDNNIIYAYYYLFDKNYIKLEEFLLLAIHNNKSNIFALYFYAEYNRIIVKNLKISKKYYNMGVRYHCIDSMLKLAEYYYTKQKYNKMVYYYKLAADNNNIKAMYNLGLYYKTILNYNSMVKYFNMAALLGDIESMEYLIQYYDNIQNKGVLTTSICPVQANARDEKNKYYILI
jgi:TPR repeat protein